MLLDGMHLPLTTPFLPDGRLNLKKLEDNVRRYSKTPASGLVALAKSGQPSLLSDAETREVFRVVAANATAEKVLIAGVRRDSVIGTIELIAYASKVEFDAVLVPMPTLLHGGRAKEVLSFFRTVADSAELPVILDSGSTAADQVSVEAVRELASHPNVIGIVDASAHGVRITDILDGTSTLRRQVIVTPVFAAVTGRMIAESAPAASGLMSAQILSSGGAALSVATASKPVLKTRTKSVGFQVLSGRTAGMLDLLLAGAVGAVPALAAAAPQACYEVLAAWKDGDPALAAEKQERVRVAALRVEEELEVAGIKYGCDLNGYFGGRPRLPTLPLTGDEREEVERLMAGTRN